MESAVKPRGPAADRLSAYEALIEIGGRLHGASEDVDGALELIVERALSLLDTDMAWLALADEARGVLRPMLLRGFRDDRFLDVELPIRLGVGGRAIARRRPIVIDDYPAYEHETDPAVREAILAEDAIAIVCAPMRRSDELTGTLYVANRRPTAFSEEQVWLLGALATQASTAIESRRLNHRLRRQNEVLERALGAQRRLMQTSLEEQGLVGLASVVSDLVGLPLVVEQDICEPRTIRVGGGAASLLSARTAGADRRVTRPIKAGTRLLGTVEVLGADALSALQTSALEQGMTMLALELLKERAAQDVGWRMSGDLLEELLDAPRPVPAALARRAKHLHVDVEAPHRFLAIAPVAGDGTALGRLLDVARGMIARRAPGQGSQALGVRRPREVLMALPEVLADTADDIARAIQDAARPKVGEVHVGVGSLNVDLAASCRAAMSCLNLARSAETPGTVVGYDSFGSLCFLLDAPDVRNAAVIAREPLEPLLEHDRVHRAPLAETTRTFLECGGNQRLSAERCFIALNTLRYRLGKIEEVLGVHPADPETAFRLTLAFKVDDLLGALGLSDRHLPAKAAR